MRKLGTHTDE